MVIYSRIATIFTILQGQHISLQAKNPEWKGVYNINNSCLSHILSGLRKLIIDNKGKKKKKKAFQYMHSKRGRLRPPSGPPWHKAKHGYL